MKARCLQGGKPCQSPACINSKNNTRPLGDRSEFWAAPGALGLPFLYIVHSGTEYCIQLPPTFLRQVFMQHTQHVFGSRPTHGGRALITRCKLGETLLLTAPKASHRKASHPHFPHFPRFRREFFCVFRKK